MRLLFDQNTPFILRRLLPEHSVTTAYDMGWSELTNGNLLTAGEKAGFQVMLTPDKRMRYQQNLSGRTIGIVVLPEQKIGVLEAGLAKMKDAIRRAAHGGYQEVSLPRPRLNRRPPPGGATE